MSKIEVDAIDKQSGSTLTIGGSGTTVQLGTGASQTGFGATGGISWQTAIKTTAFTAVSGAGWAVTDLTETTANKFFIDFNGSVANAAEILIGKKLNFEVEPDVNIQSSIDYNNEINTTLGGVEYAINVNPGQEVFTINFQNVSSTFKTNLIAFQDANRGESKKFVWYDGTTHHWVRLARPLTFTEVADGRFSTSIQLRQQIQ